MELTLAPFSKFHLFCTKNDIDTVYSWSKAEYGLFYKHKKIATMPGRVVEGMFNEEHEKKILSAIKLIDMFV
jgi:hypothetical protein